MLTISFGFEPFANCLQSMIGIGPKSPLRVEIPDRDETYSHVVAKSFVCYFRRVAPLNTGNSTDLCKTCEIKDLIFI